MGTVSGRGNERMKKKRESQGKKRPRRLEGAKPFAALSGPSHVERLWGFANRSASDAPMEQS
jgi:hypothetical protein